MKKNERRDNSNKAEAEERKEDDDDYSNHANTLEHAGAIELAPISVTRQNEPS